MRSVKYVEKPWRTEGKDYLVDVTWLRGQGRVLACSFSRHIHICICFVAAFRRSYSNRLPRRRERNWKRSVARRRRIARRRSVCSGRGQTLNDAASWKPGQRGRERCAWLEEIVWGASIKNEGEKGCTFELCCSFGAGLVAVAVSYICVRVCVCIFGVG